jgi:hypothetical protein
MCSADSGRACRYDVIYGSGGFVSYGWNGGCKFVNATYEDALSDAAAARFFCLKEDKNEFQCLHDFSGDGQCEGGFGPGQSILGAFTVTPV